MNENMRKMCREMMGGLEKSDMRDICQEMMKK